MNIFPIKLPNTVKGILLIITGSVLVLNYFDFIQIVQPILAILGLIMIGSGIILVKLHEKVYVLIKKFSSKQDNNEQPPQGM